MSTSDSAADAAFEASIIVADEIEVAGDKTPKSDPEGNLDLDLNLLEPAGPGSPHQEQHQQSRDHQGQGLGLSVHQGEQHDVAAVNGVGQGDGTGNENGPGKANGHGNANGRKKSHSRQGSNGSSANDSDPHRNHGNGGTSTTVSFCLLVTSSTPRRLVSLESVLPCIALPSV